jgi:hypothetical protein
MGRRVGTFLSPRMAADLIICGYRYALALLGALAASLYAERFDPAAAGVMTAVFVVI